VPSFAYLSDYIIASFASHYKGLTLFEDGTPAPYDLVPALKKSLQPPPLDVLIMTYDIVNRLLEDRA
jgi:hypothetical protein